MLRKSARTTRSTTNNKRASAQALSLSWEITGASVNRATPGLAEVKLSTKRGDVIGETFTFRDIEFEGVLQYTGGQMREFLRELMRERFRREPPLTGAHTKQQLRLALAQHENRPCPLLPLPTLTLITAHGEDTLVVSRGLTSVPHLHSIRFYASRVDEAAPYSRAIAAMAIFGDEGYYRPMSESSLNLYVHANPLVRKMATMIFHVCSIYVDAISQGESPDQARQTSDALLGVYMKTSAKRNIGATLGLHKLGTYWQMYLEGPYRPIIFRLTGSQEEAEQVYQRARTTLETRFAELGHGYPWEERIEDCQRAIDDLGANRINTIRAIRAPTESKRSADPPKLALLKKRIRSCRGDGPGSRLLCDVSNVEKIALHFYGKFAKLELSDSYTGFSAKIEDSQSTIGLKFVIDAIRQSRPHLVPGFGLQKPIEYTLHGSTEHNDTLTVEVLNWYKHRYPPAFLFASLVLVENDTLANQALEVSRSAGNHALSLTTHEKHAKLATEVVGMMAEYYPRYLHPCNLAHRGDFSLRYWMISHGTDILLLRAMSAQFAEDFLDFASYLDIKINTLQDVETFAKHILIVECGRISEVCRRLGIREVEESNAGEESDEEEETQVNGRRSRSSSQSSSSSSNSATDAMREMRAATYRQGFDEALHIYRDDYNLIPNASFDAISNLLQVKQNLLDRAGVDVRLESENLASSRPGRFREARRSQIEEMVAVGESLIAELALLGVTFKHMTDGDGEYASIPRLTSNGDETAEDIAQECIRMMGGDNKLMDKKKEPCEFYAMILCQNAHHHITRLSITPEQSACIEIVDLRFNFPLVRGSMPGYSKDGFMPSLSRRDHNFEYITGFPSNEYTYAAYDDSKNNVRVLSWCSNMAEYTGDRDETDARIQTLRTITSHLFKNKPWSAFSDDGTIDGILLKVKGVLRSMDRVSNDISLFPAFLCAIFNIDLSGDAAMKQKVDDLFTSADGDSDEEVPAVVVGDPARLG